MRSAAAAVGDRSRDSLLLAFGVGFSYQLGLDEPPQRNNGGGEKDGERTEVGGGCGKRERV